MTLPESFREFESWSPVKGATKHKCRSAWKKWMAFCGQYPGAGAAKFQVWLRDHAKCREAHGHPVTSVHSYCAAVSQVYRWLGEQPEYAGTVNPFTGVKRMKPDRRLVQVYSPSDLHAMLDAVDGAGFQAPLTRLRWTGFFLVGLHGLREGEIWNLRWDHDIDLAAETLRIQYRDDDRASGWWQWGTKGGSDRDVPMSEDLVNFFWRLRVHAGWLYPFLKRVTYELRLAQPWPLPERIRNYPYCNFWREFHRIRDAAKIKAGTFHTLRKNAGTHLAEQRVPMPHAQSILGHASMQTTNQYYVAVDKRLSMDNARNAFNHLPLGPVGFEPTTKGL